MKKKIVPAALIACLLINVECSEDALERSNPNSPTEASFYKTERELIAGSNAMYATLQKLEIFNSHLPYAYDLRSDEYGPTFKTGQDATLNQLYEFTVLPDNNYVLGYWRYLFEAVFRSNLEALHAYPARPYGGSVLLLRAAEHDPAGPDTLGWERLAGGGVELRVVPGSHFTLVREPHAAALAAVLGRRLDGRAAGSPAVEETGPR